MSSTWFDGWHFQSWSRHVLFSSNCAAFPRTWALPWWPASNGPLSRQAWFVAAANHTVGILRNSRACEQLAK